MSKSIYLSYILDANTSTCGNRNEFVYEKKTDISKGDTENDISVATTEYIGTHRDMPCHFFENGQTIENFDIDYFNSSNILYIDFKPENLIVNKELIEKLEKIEIKISYENLIIKTEICEKRDSDEFCESNYGFVPEVALYLRKEFPNIRIIAFDSISVSSFANRMIGRESHKEFLNPNKPILLLEDMDYLNSHSEINKLTIVPHRIVKCVGLPCPVIPEMK